MWILETFGQKQFQGQNSQSTQLEHFNLADYKAPPFYSKSGDCKSQFQRFPAAKHPTEFPTKLSLDILAFRERCKTNIPKKREH